MIKNQTIIHSGWEKLSTTSTGFSFSTSERSSENASPIFSPVFEEHSIKGTPNSAASAAPWLYVTVLFEKANYFLNGKFRFSCIENFNNCCTWKIFNFSTLKAKIQMHL